MKLYFLKQNALDLLTKSISDNLDSYQSQDMWAEQFFTATEMPNYYFDTGIETDDYQLIAGGPETDFQNAKTLFLVLKDKLNPVQASDLRLWAYMSHVQHWDYMRTRWAIDLPDQEYDDDQADSLKEPSANKIIVRIGSRYFFKAAKGKAFVRQGIARLYWGAYLTYDETNSDPFEYTEYFFSKQDIFTSITERSYARNKTIILAALKELKKHPELSRNDIRLFLSKLNQAGAVTVLDFLNSEQAEELCAKLMSETANTAVLMEGSRFKAINTVSGKPYGTGAEIIVVKGRATVLGRVLPTKPKNLTGKKEGAKFTISGKQYIIKDIREGMSHD